MSRGPIAPRSPRLGWRRHDPAEVRALCRSVRRKFRNGSSRRSSACGPRPRPRMTLEFGAADVPFFEYAISSRGNEAINKWPERSGNTEADIDGAVGRFAPAADDRAEVAGNAEPRTTVQNTERRVATLPLRAVVS